MNKKRLKIPLFIILVLSAILTRKEILLYINQCVLDSFEPLFHSIDPELFYSESFNNLAYMSLGVLTAIVIPIFISLYGNAKSSNKIVEFFIRDNFKFDDLFFVIVLTICGVVSQNSLFIFIVLLVVAIYLINKIQRYIKFLFNTRETLIKYLRDNFNQAELRGAHFTYLVKDFEKIIGRHFICTDDFNLEKNGISFSSNNYVSTFNAFKLKKWLSNLKNTINPIENSRENVTANIWYDTKKRYISIRFNFNSIKELDKALKKTVINEYSESFIYDVFSYAAEEEDPENILNNLDSYIYTLLKKNDFILFIETLALIKEILNDKILNKKVIGNLRIINYRLFVMYNDFEKTRAVSYHFFEYWYYFFNVMAERSQLEGIRFALEDLSNGIRYGIFFEDEIQDLEKKITAFYSYTELNEKFVFNYLYGLISVTVPLVNKEPINDGLILKFIKMIYDLREDFIDPERFFIHKYTEEEKNKIVSLCDEALVLVAFHIQQRSSVQIKPETMQTIFGFLNGIDVMNTAQRIYMETEQRWNISFWGDDYFDRHGMGQVRSFSTSAFLENGLISYFKYNKFDLSSSEHFEIAHNALYFFTQFEKSISALKETSTKFKTELKKIIERGQQKEEQITIDADIDKSKVDSFVEGCNRLYKKEYKFSSLIKAKIIDKENPTNAIGFHINLSKDSLIKEKSVIINALHEYGRALAFAEAKKIILDIEKQVLPTSCGLKDFYDSIFPSLIKSNKIIIFVGRTFHFYSLTFDWRTLICKYNDKIKKQTNKNDEEEYQIVEYEGKQSKVFLIETNQLENDYILECNNPNADLKLHYCTLPSNNEELIYKRENNSYYSITHYARDVNLVDEIIKKEIKSKRLLQQEKAKEITRLKLNLGFRMYITPEIEIINNKNIALYKLPKPPMR